MAKDGGPIGRGVREGVGLMAFCAKCGQPVPSGANFCPACGQRAAEPTTPAQDIAAEARLTRWRTAWRNLSQVERTDAVFLGGFVLGVAATRLANETTLPVGVLLVIAALAYLWWRPGQSSITPDAPAAVLRERAADDDDDDDDEDEGDDSLGYQGLEGDGPLGRR